MPIQRDALLSAYLDACETELRAFKPGNVSIYSEAHDMTVEDFRRSAAASGPFLCDSDLSLGEKIYHATRATREVVPCNTNLGIILLAAPLFQAFQEIREGETLRDTLRRVLGATTQTDADWTYKAIRLAQPGGLGESPDQDVRDAPEVTLLEAMRFAEHRDRIAYQYTNSFADVFDFAIPRYHRKLSQWGDKEWSAVAVFVGLLKHIPDSHIERKFGARYTGIVASRMAQIDKALSVSDRPEQVMPLLREVDAEFKSGGINPGTTADLTVACLLAVRLEALLGQRKRKTGCFLEA
ncbi:triphosphoribosyl-dephospho-CoA synthase [Methylocaldum sp. RMAD-M]|jgi:triphosphoribosyl-dephospho-CoA synthase|nr:triphosphoribosyl-dephospho-CoA synthase [Methylocaldum sp. RMAD-M]MBP1149426.1 triphosphoribosyl-dephospho-CoA synthase [Methylocaldum sp. RMAD-M]